MEGAINGAFGYAYSLYIPYSMGSRSELLGVSQPSTVIDLAGAFETFFIVPPIGNIWELSSQLTNSYFSEGLKPPTRKKYPSNLAMPVRAFWDGFSKAVCCDCLGFFSEYLEHKL